MIYPTEKESNIIMGAYGVSRETMTHLENYVSVLLKWNQSINLVSKKTEKDVWVRHVIDSLQLLPLVEKSTRSHVVDVGSGGGFPGVILSLVQKKEMTLIESVEKKVSFLRFVLSKKQANIFHGRAENFVFSENTLIVCRAFASLCDLFSLLVFSESCDFLLLKGEGWKNEINQAQCLGWHFSYEIFPSVTHDLSVVLLIKDVVNEYHRK